MDETFDCSIDYYRQDQIDRLDIGVYLVETKKKILHFCSGFKSKTNFSGRKVDNFIRYFTVNFFFCIDISNFSIDLERKKEQRLRLGT